MLDNFPLKNFPLKKIIRPLLGVLLIAMLVYQLNWNKLSAIFVQADWRWFLVGCISLIISNQFSILRWQNIVRQMGFSVAYVQMLYLYMQGITANTVLPGGIVGGDVWRTVSLGKLSAFAGNSHFANTDSAASVLLDRVGGLWGLSLFSLIGIVLCYLFNFLSLDFIHSHAWVIALYMLGLLAVVLVPFIILLVRDTLMKRASFSNQLAKLNNKWLKKITETITIIANHLHVLFTTLLQSLFVQIFAVFALYACLRAVGVEISYVLVAAVSFAIFVSAIIPASISGFGARELGAVAVLGTLAVNAESAFLASFLYGLAGTVQGVFGIYFWVKKAP